MAKISVLRSKKGIMTKTFGSQYEKGVKQYDRAFWFTHTDYEANNIYELSELLSAMEPLSECIVVRGKLRDDVDPNGDVLRRKDAYDGNRAYYEANPDGVQWVLLDFDKIPAPSWLQPEERLEYLISLLPEYLHDVTYHYQWSSSAGVYGWDSLSCHIWMWLAYPRTDTEMEHWAIENGTVDEAVMRTIQVHYTAAPIFEDVADPLPQGRSGFVEKGSAVANIPVVAPPSTVYTTRWVATTNGGVVNASKGGFDTHLATIGTRLHMPIQKAICAWLASTGVNSDLERLKERLREQIRTSPRSDIALYLSDGYLNQCIRSGQRKIPAAPDGPTRVPETAMDKLRLKLGRTTK